MEFGEEEEGGGELNGVESETDTSTCSSHGNDLFILFLHLNMQKN